MIDILTNVNSASLELAGEVAARPTFLKTAKNGM